MCGIIGYLGKKPVVPLIIDGLRFLEYRGYDSAGVAYLDDKQVFQIYKASGKLINLERILPTTLYEVNGKNMHVGIGHIRWATHGAATEANAHPHISYQKEISLVHNGIIENFIEIRDELQKQGYQFVSETDTECVVHLLEAISREEEKRLQRELTADDFVGVIRKALSKLQGAYALSVISKKHPNHLFAVRNHAPLVVGIGEEEYLVASDTVAIADHTNQIVYLNDQEIVQISPEEGLKLYSPQGERLTPVVELVNLGPLQIDKKGYKHFMLKEIYEQPDVVRNSLSGRLVSVDEPIRILSREEDCRDTFKTILQDTRRIVIVGCGTSYNAGLVGKYFIEEMVRIPVEVESAGEYRYRNPVIDSHTLVIAISQSGETADTLEATRQSARNGAKIIALTNREDSSLAREADLVLPVRAGIEVSVCATKSFIAQILVFYLFGIAMAEAAGTANPVLIKELKVELLKIPTLLESLLSNTEPIQVLAKKYESARDVLFIARGINYPVALEGALKLKEISYIHAEGYSASELKHGPIAMLDDTVPVIAILVPGIVLEKTLSNCQEAKARDARLVAFTSVALAMRESRTFEDVVGVPLTRELLSPLLTAVPLQLLAYYIAEHLGKDVDQPRNLAKSVTVE